MADNTAERSPNLPSRGSNVELLRCQSRSSRRLKVRNSRFKVQGTFVRLLPFCLLLLFPVLKSRAAEPSVIPVGLDAYRLWDHWPYQRIGMRAYLRSTYDRRGGNEGADASHFLYQLADDFNVTLDVAGPGVLYFVRCNHWHGSPWHYEVDGVDHLVQETSTAEPDHPVENSVFIPQRLFPTPLAWTWSITKGADLNWVPIPFKKTFRLAYSRTRYGTGYYIYQLYDRSAKLSRPIHSWDGKRPPDGDVLQLISRAGTDIAPRANTSERTHRGVTQTGGGPISLGRGLAREIKNITCQQPAMLRALEFSVPREQAIEFGRARLRITWDELSRPSVDAPVALFFGAGTLYNRDDREYLVKGFPISVRFERPGHARLRSRQMVNAPGASEPVSGPLTPALSPSEGERVPDLSAVGLAKAEERVRGNTDSSGAPNAHLADERVHLACYFPMPFFRSARIELVGPGGTNLSGLQWSVRYQPLKDPPDQVAYFHATYRDHPHPEPGKDLVLLDTLQVEGGGDWSGNFVGTSWIFSHRAALNTLEGDPRFFFDDSQTPQGYGTGTEEWGGGGDYWGGRNMTLPFAGHPAGARNEKEAKNDEDKIESAYRFLLADLFPFGKRAVIRLEHGGENQSTEHYETVTYWYGVNRPTLIKTDELKIGDAASEKAHRYASPDASPLYEITSRYEWGVDTLNGKEIYPAHTDSGRKTTGESEFTLKLAPDNYGVLLRRKLDYSLPNQRAEVYVADAGTPDRPAKPKWKFAGTWYLAGANTCVYSNPKEELGATQHIVQTSNRRFRDDEFLVPRELTRNRSAIRVRVKFTPIKIPLFPGQPVSEPAWSEIRYDAYCWVMPDVKPR